MKKKLMGNKRDKSVQWMNEENSESKSTMCDWLNKQVTWKIPSFFEGNYKRRSLEKAMAKGQK